MSLWYEFRAPKRTRLIDGSFIDRCFIKESYGFYEYFNFQLLVNPIAQGSHLYGRFPINHESAWLYVNICLHRDRVDRFLSSSTGFLSLPGQSLNAEIIADAVPVACPSFGGQFDLFQAEHGSESDRYP